MIALCIYEYLITFRHEVSIFWQKKMNVTSVMFATTRWVMLLMNFVNAFATPRANALNVRLQICCLKLLP